MGFAAFDQLRVPRIEQDRGSSSGMVQLDAAGGSGSRLPSAAWFAGVELIASPSDPGISDPKPVRPPEDS